MRKFEINGIVDKINFRLYLDIEINAIRLRKSHFWIIY